MNEDKVVNGMDVLFGMMTGVDALENVLDALQERGEEFEIDEKFAKGVRVGAMMALEAVKNDLKKEGI